MKRLSPHEIIDGNSYTGRKRRDVISMAEHYGFVQANEGTNFKHLLFKHRDYTDLTFTLQHDSTEVGWPYVQDAVKCCMEVKARNAKRKEPVFKPLPAWAWKALPEGSFVTKSDQSVIYEVDDASERRYLLRLRGDKLSMRSLDYPRDAFSASFTIRDGSVNIAGLSNVFDQLDSTVSQHMQEVTQCYEKDLDGLKTNHGYQAVTQEGLDGIDCLVLTHPAYSGALELPVLKPGQPVSDETVEKLHALREECRDACLAQMERLEQLSERGWKVEQHAANGAAATIRLTGPGGENIELPTYGLNHVFDSKALEAQLATATTPQRTVNATQHQGCEAPANVSHADKIAAARQGMLPRRA